MLVLAAEASDPLPVAIVLAAGFLLGAWGHAIRSTWLVAFGIAPMPVWIVAPSGIRSATRPAITWSTVSGCRGGTAISGRSLWHQPTTWLTWSWLRPNVRGMCSVTSRKNRARPMKLDV